MPFTYDDPAPQTFDDVVAYIDRDGDFVLKNVNDRGTLIWSGPTDYPGSHDRWDWEPGRAKRVFRKGDSVTITF